MGKREIVLPALHMTDALLLVAVVVVAVVVLVVAVLTF